MGNDCVLNLSSGNELVVVGATDHLSMSRLHHKGTKDAIIKAGLPPPVFGLLRSLSWSLTVLHSAPARVSLWNFDDNGTDGFGPYAGLIMDTSGNLYGTTTTGGAYRYGTVFKLAPPSTSGANWIESILWSFGNGADGNIPYAGLIMDKSGNLYGTTPSGGAYRYGTVFKLAPPSTSGGNWTESILWNFDLNGTDGYRPSGGLIMDASGNLYGTTADGGTYHGLGYGGTVFELTPPTTVGGNWIESIRWNFDDSDNNDGAFPSTGLIMDKRGNLYGTTNGGGAYGRPNGDGTAFEISNITSATGAQIFVKPALIGFPPTAIGSTSTAKLLVRNSGTGQLIGTVNTAPTIHHIFGLSGSGSFVLAPQTETTITLTFTPTSTTTSRKLGTVLSNSVNFSIIKLGLQGTGTPPPPASP